MCRAAISSPVTTAAWTQILGFFAKTMELSGGSFRTDVHDVVANDDHAVALFASRAERDGQTYANRNVLVIHIRNGKLTETWLMSEDQSRGR
jgi:ketosteroid isomerase-like protein